MVIWKRIFNKKRHAKGQRRYLNCILKEISEFTRWLRQMDFRHTEKHAQLSPVWGAV